MATREAATGRCVRGRLTPDAPAGLAPARDYDARCHQLPNFCISFQSLLKRETDERERRELRLALLYGSRAAIQRSRNVVGVV